MMAVMLHTAVNAQMKPENSLSHQNTIGKHWGRSYLIAEYSIGISLISLDMVGKSMLIGK